MKLYQEPQVTLLEPPLDPSWPSAVEMILSAMEAGAGLEDDRRVGTRQSYRAKAHLRLYSDAPDAPPWTLYSRDIDRKSMGFITQHVLPLGYGGKVTFFDSTGVQLTVGCTLIRCRRAIENWYEGALNFHRPLWQFDPEQPRCLDE